MFSAFVYFFFRKPGVVLHLLEINYVCFHLFCSAWCQLLQGSVGKGLLFIWKQTEVVIKPQVVFVDTRDWLTSNDDASGCSSNPIKHLHFLTNFISDTNVRYFQNILQKDIKHKIKYLFRCKVSLHLTSSNYHLFLPLCLYQRSSHPSYFHLTWIIFESSCCCQLSASPP